MAFNAENLMSILNTFISSNILKTLLFCCTSSEAGNLGLFFTDVLKKPSPYFEIFRLPELLDKFISLYGSLLKETQKPIDIAISDARQRVFEDLKDKKCHDKLPWHLYRIDINN